MDNARASRRDYARFVSIARGSLADIGVLRRTSFVMARERVHRMEP